MNQDRRPVGVFDSGLGGLTAVRELARLLPGENIVYLGDTGRNPYGTRSNEVILRYTREDLAFLKKYDVKAILIACGTVSSVALGQLDKSLYPPIFGVVEGAARAAAKATKNGRIGVLGTQATIRSGAYEKRLRELMGEVQVTAEACPLFVPLVENGYIKKDDPLLTLAAEEYLAPLKAAGTDTVILGCTHYPIIRDCLQKLVPDMTLIDPGYEAAGALKTELTERGLLSDEKQGRARFFVTDEPEPFARIGSLFLGGEIEGQCERVTLL